MRLSVADCSSVPCSVITRAFFSGPVRHQSAFKIKNMDRHEDEENVLRFGAAAAL